MLPFSTIDFFILFFAIILVVHFFKQLFSKFISYSSLIFSISLLYAIFIYPKPYHLLGFIIYCFIVFYLFTQKYKNANKLIIGLVIALPMILVKLKSFNYELAFAGLSYMTFRAIQVYVDNETFSEKVTAKNFFSFLLFTPTLLIGPIDRYERFKGDLNNGYANLNAENFFYGWRLFLLGILQKYILAELVHRYWLGKLDEESEKIPDMLNNMYSYSAFLFFDFAGYSLLAVGFGLMLGIKVPMNFNKPYFASNPQDFWRRWHITLGDWLRDYFFRPIYKWLSGIKTLKNFPLAKQNISIFSTFALMGMWNGFEINYIASGCLFGAYSVVHTSYNFYAKKSGKDLFTSIDPFLAKVISIFLMFNFACFAIYVFSGRFPFISDE